METSVVQQPMIIIALSPREAKAALEDPEQLQTAIRREWLSTQGHAPLALPAPSTDKLKLGKPRGKMGGAKAGKKKSPMRDCKICGKSFVTQGFLDRHLRTVHQNQTIDEPVDDDDDE